MKTACKIIVVVAVVLAMFCVAGVFVNRGPWMEKTISVLAGVAVMLIIIAVLYYIGSV